MHHKDSSARSRSRPGNLMNLKDVHSGTQR
jgi:hypothetical protein